MWVHCDAAYGGAFCVCPEYRHHMQGLELCDSLTVNAHKALLTPFDLSTMYRSYTLLCLFTLYAPYYSALFFTPPSLYIRYLRDSSWLVRALSLDPNHEVCNLLPLP